MGRRDYSVSARIKGRDEASGVFRRVGRGIRRHLGAPLRGINRGIGGIQRGLHAIPGAALIGGGLIDAGRTLVEFATDAATAGDSIAKTARKAGISAQSLQTLGYAAGIAGASQETLNRGVQDFARYLGQLRAGTGPLKTLLDKVAPDLRDMLLAAEDTETALRLMFDAMGELDSDRRMTLAMAAFGRSGRDLALIAEGGSDSITKLEERARKYGHIMGGEALKSSEEFNDSLLDLKIAWQGLKNVFGAQLVQDALPHLQKLTDWLATNKEEVYAIARGFATDIVGGMKDVAEALPGVLRGFEKIGKFLVGIADFFSTVVGDSLYEIGQQAQGRIYTGSADQIAAQYIGNREAARRYVESGGNPIGGFGAAGKLELFVDFRNAPAGTRTEIGRSDVPVTVRGDVGRAPRLP